MSYACTWCAASLESRAALERHFVANPDCSKNRTVSNGTQSKYGEAGDRPAMPGQPTLDLTEKIAKASRGQLAAIGLNALIDEATGYQDVRKPDALQQMLADGQLVEHTASDKGPRIFEIVHEEGADAPD